MIQDCFARLCRATVFLYIWIAALSSDIVLAYRLVLYYAEAIDITPYDRVPPFPRCFSLD